MANVLRYDAVKPSKVRIDENGIMRCIGTIARVGVQEYIRNDGTIIREFRPPDEVEASVESFSHQPITLNHPPVMVDSRNSKDYQKGHSGLAEFKDGVIEAPLVVTHYDAVSAATTSHKQLSCGYFADLVEESGEWVDELGVQGKPGTVYKYDSVQRNIRGNHIALVPRGRAGKIASIHDSEDNFAVARLDGDDYYINVKRDEKSMTQFIYDSEILTVEGQDAERVKSIIEKLSSKLDSLTVEFQAEQAAKADLETAKSELEGKIAGLELQISQTPEQPKLDADQVATEAIARLDAWKEVAEIVKDGVTPDYSLSVSEIYKAGAKLAAPHLSEKLDSADESFVRGMWEVLKVAPARVAPTTVVKEAIVKSDYAEVSDGVSAMEKARRAQMDRLSNAWKQK